MRLIADAPHASVDMLTGDAVLSLRIAPESKRMLSELKKLADSKLAVDVKKYRPRRSLDANAYLWVLCDKIASAVESTKELIYIELVRRVGKFAIVAVREKDADEVIHGWSCRGLGWFAEIMDGCKIDGCVRVMFFYGSSAYNTKEMSRLIDEAVLEAKELEIDTATPDEIALMKERWNDEKQANKGA